MPTFSLLPSGKWRVQVRRRGLYRAASFEMKREAKEWASGIESQANHLVACGFVLVPKGSTVADLIGKYTETVAKLPGRTKAATLAMHRARSARPPSPRCRPSRCATSSIAG